MVTNIKAISKIFKLRRPMSDVRSQPLILSVYGQDVAATYAKWTFSHFSSQRAQSPAIHLYQICDEIVSLFLPSSGSWPPPRQRCVKAMKFRNIWQPPIAKRFKLESCFYLTLTGPSPERLYSYEEHFIVAKQARLH